VAQEEDYPKNHPMRGHVPSFLEAFTPVMAEIEGDQADIYQHPNDDQTKRRPPTRVGTP
jgi:hypothetical protein